MTIVALCAMARAGRLVRALVVKFGNLYNQPMHWRMILITICLSVSVFRAAEADENSWTRVADMPTARESVAACAVDDFVYAIGGFPGGSDAGIAANERYDPTSDAWSVRAPMPTGRRMPAAAVVDGKCYLIGGRLTDGPRAVDVVEVYDPASDSWQTVTPIPTARFGHSAVAVGEIIYVFGGGERGLVRANVEAYDTRTDTWSDLGTMPVPRALMGAAALDGKIFLVGGTQDGSSGSVRVDIFDPLTRSWSTGANMPSARFSLQAAVVNGRLYAVGGTNGPGALRTVEAYDPMADAWSDAADMITWRARFAVAVSAGQIYAIGGTTSFATPHVGMSDVERYMPPAAATGVMINAGMNDAWFNPLTPGQGFMLTVFPEQGQVFLAWFTYDVERPPESATVQLGEAGHRWLTAQGPYTGNTANLTLFVTRGGVFDAPGPAAETDPSGDGYLTLEFADCYEGLVTYEITSAGLAGEIPIQRIVNDGVALCEQLSRSMLNAQQ